MEIMKIPPTEILVAQSESGFPPRNAQHDKTQDQPPEILCETFMNVCGGNVNLPPLNDGYPWILGHVCSRWRRILWNSPTIWNRITVSGGKRRFNYTSNPLFKYAGAHEKILREALEHILHNIAVPISLTVKKGNLTSVLDIILTHLERFFELSLDDIYHQTLFDILNLPPNRFSELEKLELSIMFIREPVPDCPTSAFETAPKLRSVTLKMPHPTYIPPLLLFPWARMEEIRIEVMALSPIDVYKIWHSAPALITCSLLIQNVEIIPPPQKITLPALRFLRLRTAAIFDWDVFLASIVTPSLKFLTISSPTMSPQPLTSLIIRSSCPIQKLRIFEGDNQVEMATMELEVLFGCLTSMTHFLVTWSIPPPAICAIHRGALPNLTDAYFSVHPEAFGACLDMIDCHIEQSGSSKRSFTSFGLLCHNGIGFAEMHHRYQACHETYNSTKGLIVFALNGITHRKMEVDSDDYTEDEQTDDEDEDI